MVEAVIEAIENAGLRFDLAAAVVGGIISYARLKVELAEFFSQALPRARYSIGDLFTAAFGSHAHTGLLVLGVLSGAALGFILTRSLMSVFRVAFPEVIKQVAESDPNPQLVPYRLPPWPDEGKTPQFVIGEEHHSDGRFCSAPSWHVIPLKGLVGSVLVVGAPGTAKTAAVILPFIEQLTEFRAHDPASKVSLFVLDRKGSLGQQVRKIAERHGRSRDLVVLRLGGPKLNLLSDALPAASMAACRPALAASRPSPAISRASCASSKRKHGTSIWLPNGMGLHYPGLRAIYDQEGRLQGFKYKSNGADKHIYGGLLCENIVQALAGVIIREEMVEVDNLYAKTKLKKGEIAKIATMTHDEIVSVIPERLGQKLLDANLKIMKTPPAWASDLPINAEAVGWATNYSI